jgi:hypothetical protein
MKFPTGKRKYPVIVNLFDQHLAQALDELWQVLEMKESQDHNDALIKWRLASSCILHSFYAIDSLVNYLAYQYFKNSNSIWYIEPEDRIFITEKQLKDWQNLSFKKRMGIVWKEKKFTPVPIEINNKMLELKNLRNSVSHGKPYTIIFEQEFIQTDKDTVRGIIHSTYPEPNQNSYFGEKFNSPAYLNRNDARKAVCVALEIIVYTLNQAKGFHFILKTFHGGAKEFWLDGNKPVSEILKDFGIS